MKLHKKAHCYLPTADVIESALDSVMISLAPLMDLKIDGVGSTAHHDALSAMPEKIQIGLLSSIAEAFPAATYLPTGIGSNQAILGIVNHQAGSEVGGYKIGQLLDGINTGDTYLSSVRRVALTFNADRTTGAGALSLTAGGAANIKLLRGRTQVFVNGFHVAEENPNTNSCCAEPYQRYCDPERYPVRHQWLGQLDDWSHYSELHPGAARRHLCRGRGLPGLRAAA